MTSWRPGSSVSRTVPEPCGLAPSAAVYASVSAAALEPRFVSASEVVKCAVPVETSRTIGRRRDVTPACTGTEISFETSDGPHVGEAVATRI